MLPVEVETGRKRRRLSARRRFGLLTWRRGLLAAVLLGGVLGCGSPVPNRAHLTVATSWGALAAAALHQELLTIAHELGAVDVDVKVYSPSVLREVLSRQFAGAEETQVDLAVVPNDWLGPLAQRGLLAELAASRVAKLQEQLVGRALLAVTDGDRVLAYPLSADVVAFIYNPHFFPLPPGSLEAVLTATSLPPGVVPFAFDVMEPTHVAPLAASLGGGRADETGVPRIDTPLLLALFGRMAPLWGCPDCWRLFHGSSLESLHVQLFSEGRLASFLGGPWLLEALEPAGQPFVVVPVPPFSAGGEGGGAFVRYQCVAVQENTPWLDLALEVGARLATTEVNDRLNGVIRRLPVRAEAYRSRRSLETSGVLGFLRALETGRYLSAGEPGFALLEELRHTLLRFGPQQTPPALPELERLLQAEEGP